MGLTVSGLLRIEVSIKPLIVVIVPGAEHLGFRRTINVDPAVFLSLTPKAGYDS
jgi:hypothetical protein